MREGKTLRMDTDSRSKFYVSGKISSKVRSFHTENNKDKQLWFTVEQLLEAGLNVLSKPEQKRAA